MPLSFFLFLSIFYLSINLITTDNAKVKSPANPNNHFTCQIYECCAIFFLGLRYLVDFWSSNKRAMVLILLAQVVFGFFLELRPGRCRDLVLQRLCLCYMTLRVQAVVCDHLRY